MKELYYGGNLFRVFFVDMGKVRTPIKKENKENFLIHCKHCRAPLVKDMETRDMDGSVSFLIKCPHCKEDCVIKIDIETSKTLSVEVN